MIHCEPLDEKYCDLVFYMTMHERELDPVNVVAIYSRLTTNFIVSFVGEVEVHSHIRGKRVSFCDQFSVLHALSASLLTIHTCFFLKSIFKY